MADLVNSRPVSPDPAANEVPARRANGNRLTADAVRDRFSGTYDDQDRLLTYGTVSYTYTAHAELATKTPPAGVTQYTYDALGNLTQVVLPDGREITYRIDGRNRRVAKLVDGVRMRAWLYADQLRPIAELDGTGNVVSRFVHASRSNVPDYFIRDGLWYKIIADHLGSPRIMLDAWTLETATPKVVQRLDYDPFGIVTYDSAPGWQPFGYAGGLYDPDTKLLRFGARDYDSETGRWTSKDPIGFQGGDLNLYGYALDDPINVIDPAGLYSFDQALKNASDFSAGFGDTLTSGLGLFDTSLTELARQGLEDVGLEPEGTNEVVDPCSGFYMAGEVGAYGWAAAAGGTGSTPRGWLFGRGRGLLNRNDYLRIGWGWKGTAESGKEVFRVAARSQRLPFHWHFP